MQVLSKNNAILLAFEKLRKSGCLEENLEGITDAILDAEYSGIKSHGFHYLPIYCNHLKIGKINGHSKAEIEEVSPAAIKVNADNGFAQSAINLGLTELTSRADKEGIACMSIYNSYNCGVLGYHTKRIANADLVGMGFTNAPASIAPIGGVKAVVGTNPFSIAVPYEGDVKIIIDQSASIVAKSEISLRAKNNESIPEGWAFDKEGKTTTNPNDALKGTMAPSGGHKGFGLGLLVEILTACVAGGNLGIHASSFAGEDGGPPSTGQFFIAINAKKFNPNFSSSLQSLINAIEIQEGSRVPGSKRLKYFQANSDQDIEIKDDLYTRILEI